MGAVCPCSLGWPLSGAVRDTWPCPAETAFLHLVGQGFPRRSGVLCPAAQGLHSPPAASLDLDLGSCLSC